MIQRVNKLFIGTVCFTLIQLVNAKQGAESDLPTSSSVLFLTLSQFSNRNSSGWHWCGL